MIGGLQVFRNSDRATVTLSSVGCTNLAVSLSGFGVALREVESLYRRIRKLVRGFAEALEAERYRREDFAAAMRFSWRRVPLEEGEPPTPDEPPARRARRAPRGGRPPSLRARLRLATRRST